MTKVVTLICTCCLLPLSVGPSVDSLTKYHKVESFEVQPGILAVPVYSAKGELCVVSLEKRHYWGKKVDMDAVMSKEQILQAFDQLAPRELRGQPGLNMPGGSEHTEVDAGIRQTIIVYEHVSLTMIGREKSLASVTALIEWKNRDCEKEIPR
ncbi:MAG: hypothetical protein HYX26_03390 [Acidobacteriales bacterium]|nr:hypothetical protein [Terriglobales bacterium]